LRSARVSLRVLWRAPPRLYLRPRSHRPLVRSGSQQGAKHEAHEAHLTAPTAKVDVAAAMRPLASSPLGVAATRALLYEVAMANHARPTAKAVTYT
jgi:hypothetical protein